MKTYEECGIFACYAKDNNAFEYIKYGLYMLRHRGQEAAGITVSSESYENTGLVENVFENDIELKGNLGIGYVKYSSENAVCPKVILESDKIIGVQDPNGFHPLMFCEADEGYFLASEDCAFKGLTIHKIIEIQAGEQIEITKDGWTITKYTTEGKTSRCVFEQIYLANPESHIFDKNVYDTRIELGKKIAQEDNIEADVVVPVIYSGLAFAIGYSQESKIPMHLALKRNKLLRSFIQPSQQEREEAIKEKFSIIKSVVEGKRVILADDSIVRGTTTKYLTKLLKESGAKEVHIRLSSPPIINTCRYGVDIPDIHELLSPKFQAEELAKYLGADSVKFISTEKFQQVFDTDKFCYNCFKK